MTLKESEIFLAFNYKELKDLGKHFLTISSASLVFALSFLNRNVLVVERESNLDLNNKQACGLLIISIICAGIGLFTNYISGSGAANSMMWGIGKNYRLITKFTYLLYISAGVSLILAYLIFLNQFKEIS